MGGRGSGSGLKKESMFKPISLSGKTGTDKQKKIRTRFVGINEEYSSS